MALSKKSFGFKQTRFCRHVLINHLYNGISLFVVNTRKQKTYGMPWLRNTRLNVSKQKLVIDNYYWWEMNNDKYFKSQTNEYQSCSKTSGWLNCFVLIIFNRYLDRNACTYYKQQHKHKSEQMSLSDLLVHIIIEDTNCIEVKIDKAKELSPKPTWCKESLE